jgi:hypothetical protein
VTSYFFDVKIIHQKTPDKTLILSYDRKVVN